MWIAGRILALDLQEYVSKSTQARCSETGSSGHYAAYKGAPQYTQVGCVPPHHTHTPLQEKANLERQLKQLNSKSTLLEKNLEKKEVQVGGFKQHIAYSRHWVMHWTATWARMPEQPCPWHHTVFRLSCNSQPQMGCPGPGSFFCACRHNYQLVMQRLCWHNNWAGCRNHINCCSYPKQCNQINIAPSRLAACHKIKHNTLARLGHRESRLQEKLCLSPACCLPCSTSCPPQPHTR